jgi:outer membrane protein TolC
MTMQKISLMQEVPNADKRHAREEVAAASVEVANSRRQIARQAVRRNTALAWLDLYYLQRKEALFDELDRENAILANAVNAQIAGGRGQVADALAPKQESAQLADRRDDLARDIARAQSRLRQFVGAELNDGLAGEPPALEVDARLLRQRLHQHPELLAFAAETRKAEAEVREAQSMKTPDWGVELAYQRRAREFGNMVSLQFSLDLPISPSTRQNPLIAAKERELARIDAERDGMLREHTNELESMLAEVGALSRQLERARQIVLPLSEQKLALQTASYQAGRGDLNAVLTARKERIDQRMRIIELEAQRAAAAARLRFAYEVEVEVEVEVKVEGDGR